MPRALVPWPGLPAQAGWAEQRVDPSAKQGEWALAFGSKRPRLTSSLLARAGSRLDFGDVFPGTEPPGGSAWLVALDNCRGPSGTSEGRQFAELIGSRLASCGKGGNLPSLCRWTWGPREPQQQGSDWRVALGKDDSDCYFDPFQFGGAHRVRASRTAESQGPATGPNDGPKANTDA